MRLFVFIFLFAYISGLSVETPPRLLRACMDFDNDIVYLSWTKPSDLCNSFQRHSIYGSENGGVFHKISDIFDISTTSYAHVLAAQNTNWQYYITTHTTCNGIDSVQSNTIGIDVTYPANIELDSVSVDIATQKIVAGWSKNPSPDTKHYELYDYSSGNGDYLDKTTGLGYVVSDIKTGYFPVVLATLDSCNLSSLLSKPHTPMRLSGALDTCKRSVMLSWTPYVGWGGVDSINVYVSIDTKPYKKKKTLSGSAKSWVFNEFNLGESVDFYVRAYSNNASSSSNIIKVKTRAPKTPFPFSIRAVDVVDNSVNIRWLCKNNKDVEHFYVLAGSGGAFREIINTENEPDKNYYTGFDYKNDPNKQAFRYTIVAISGCGDTLGKTDTVSSLYLDNNYTPIHNKYTGWLDGVLNYELEYIESFTWNNVYSNNEPITDNTLISEAGCYRIVANEVKAAEQSEKVHSNEVCVNEPFQVYVTSAIAPDGVNKTFSIKGTGIDHQRSIYYIYNRWGELLFKSNTNEKWDATYKDKPLVQGKYLYIVKAYSVLGDFETFKGTLHVVR